MKRNNPNAPPTKIGFRFGSYTFGAEKASEVELFINQNKFKIAVPIVDKK